MEDSGRGAQAEGSGGGPLVEAEARAEHLGGGPRRRWRPRVEGPGLPYAFSALYLVMFICAALPCFSEKSEKMVAVWSRRAD